MVSSLLLLLLGCSDRGDSLPELTRSTEQWRAQRVANLTRDDGWLTLAGLYWLQQGNNRFGGAAGNELQMAHPALPDTMGVFMLQQGKVMFTASPGSAVTHEGKAIRQLELQPDSAAEPTQLAIGSLRFHIIERGGQYGVRIRDLEHAARQHFAGLSYFPISTDWKLRARFERYTPSKQIPIINILGMVENTESPGALVFEKDGKPWRLDVIQESPTDTELFVMFADATSGRESYGAGRYLYVARPADDAATSLWLDFNRAYNPPCAFTEFATCPLPPGQNRLQLAVTAGERKYSGH